MRFTRPEKFTKVVIDGHLIDTLKVTDEFKCVTHNDTLKISFVGISWHHLSSPYRYIVTIYSEFEDVTGYPVNLTDFYVNDDNLNTRTDIYVYSYGGTQLSHWLKLDENNSVEEFWVKVPLKRGENTLYIYYGSGSENLGNGNDVFEFFDDFDYASTLKWDSQSVVVSNSLATLNDSSYLLSKDTFTLHKAMVVKAKFTSLDNEPFIGFTSNDLKFGFTPELDSINLDQWHRLEIVRVGTKFDFYVDKTRIQSIPFNDIWYKMNIECKGPCNIDYLFVRKYLEPEPKVVGIYKQSG